MEKRNMDFLIVLLLVLYGGFGGLHRFYLGKTATGFFMLFTLGGLGIRWLVDFIMVASGGFKDLEGNLIKPQK